MVVQNFTGCVQNVYLNSTNLIRDVKDSYSYGDSLKYEKINTLYSCPVSMVVYYSMSSNGIRNYLPKNEKLSCLNFCWDMMRRYSKIISVGINGNNVYINIIIVDRKVLNTQLLLNLTMYFL